MGWLLRLTQNGFRVHNIVIADLCSQITR